LWWLGAAWLTFELASLRVLMFCPVGLREGIDCYAQGWISYPTWLVTFGVSLSAIFVVAIPAIVAPNYKYNISLCAFVVGCFFATALGISTQYYTPLLFSLIAGSITFYIVVHLTR